MGLTDYEILPIRLITDSSTILRYLYLKRHEGEDNLPKDRTAFIAGVPAQLTEEVLFQVLSKFGIIERLAIHKTGVSAVVIYSLKSSMSKAFKFCSRKADLKVDVSTPTQAHGLKAWVEAHKLLTPGNAQLQKSLDDWMEKHEKEEEAKKSAAIAAMEDDGWTVVRRHKGRKKNASETGVTVGGVSGAAAQAAADKKSNAVFADFYRFQQRERRRNQVVTLREQFESDKLKLAALKSARKFKPY